MTSQREKRLAQIRKHVDNQVTEYLLLHDTQAVILHTCPKCNTRYQLPNQRLNATFNITDLIMNYVEKNEMLWQSVWEELAKSRVSDE